MSDPLKRTELHYAAVEGNHERVEELLGSGVDPNEPDSQGFTPLHFAAQAYEPAIVARLLASGAVVDAVNGVGNTPLGLAVFNSQGRGEVISLLLGAGADPHHPNRAGVSPWMLAERIANYDVKQFLAEAD